MFNQLPDRTEKMIHFQLLHTCVTIMLFTTMICFITGEITRNYSQVDKLWSIMPVIYSLEAFIGFPSLRTAIMCLLVIIWGSRLSYNFYRKGGYSIIPWKGEEDYRWKYMRTLPLLNGRVRFGIFNLIFISFYQNLLILLFSSPLLMAAYYRETGLKILDLAAALLMFLFIVIESAADNQLSRFQKIKKTGQKPESVLAKSLEKGFLTEGLWAYVRHPNYISEQCIWISFYLFGVAASGKWLNWTLAGSFLLVLLFIGSTELTERLSCKKYPAYTDYKRDVPKFFPVLFK
jgi:steroid 5-alpha reductase family enzyme